MNITFGLHLDAQQGPSRRQVLGDPALGRLGFVGLLETYLGLSRPAVSAAKRVTAYLGHLRRCDSEDRFYRGSLQADSVGTAAKLLSWRDEWRLAGWDGTAPPGSPARIQDMADVEASAFGQVPVGEAERLMAVEAALRAGALTPIRSVLLVDPLESFPWAWRQVLAAIGNVVLNHPEPQGEGPLRELQLRALAAVSQQGFAPLDIGALNGAVMALRASSRELAEHFMSAAHRLAPADRLLVCEQGGASLDTTFVATGAAGNGFSNASSLRPALQALGLALQTCWTPLHTGRLLEFLTHPFGPFSRRARARLAESVATQPGIGGPRWEECKQALTTEDDGARLLEEIAFWLEGDRWSRQEGAPVEALRIRVDRLATAFRARLQAGGAASPTFAPAVAQCAAFLEGLAEFETQGVARLTPRQIEQLLHQSTSQGACDPEAVAQVGCLRTETVPAACIEAAQQVIWWMPSTPQLPDALPWTASEVQALARQGVALRDPASELKELAVHWMRPLLMARQRFVLILPPAEDEEHPFTQILFTLVPGLKTSVTDLDTMMATEYLGGPSAAIPHRAIPEVPEQIRLEAGLAVGDAVQSYSSLSAFFNAPALHALKTAARLRVPATLSAEEDNRLLGTLAHRVLEQLLTRPGALQRTDEQAVEWFRAHVDTLLQQEGAVLLMEGASVGLERFKMVCEAAIRSLMHHLRTAGALAVHMEVPCAGSLGAVPLKGAIDMVIDLPEGRQIILDVKWRGDKHYREILGSGAHLQLALYASMVEQSTGRAPVAVGYFLIESANLYLSAPDLIADAIVAEPPAGAAAELLQRAAQTWKWRCEQWGQGILDVVPEGGGDDFQGPAGTLPVEGPNRWDSDHLVLLGGWEA